MRPRLPPHPCARTHSRASAYEEIQGNFRSGEEVFCAHRSGQLVDFSFVVSARVSCCCPAEASNHIVVQRYLQLQTILNKLNWVVGLNSGAAQLVSKQKGRVLIEIIIGSANFTLRVQVGKVRGRERNRQARRRERTRDAS